VEIKLYLFPPRTLFPAESRDPKFKTTGRAIISGALFSPLNFIINGDLLQAKANFQSSSEHLNYKHKEK